jgi:hypothetical protein
MYEVVLREAHTETEIEESIAADLLRELWPAMTLPAHIRGFWEQAHPSHAA